MIRRSLLLAAIGLCAAIPLVLLALRPSREAMASPDAAPAGARDAGWIAAAPGIVEPNGGFLHLGFPEAGRIVEVLVHAGEVVHAGDVLVRIADDARQAHIAAAEAELAFRIADRDGTADAAVRDDPVRLKAEIDAAERDASKAQAALDAATMAGGDIATAQKTLEAADAALQDKQAALRAGKAMAATRGPVNRKTAAVDAARAELVIVRAEAEKALLKAPVDGTVLAVSGKPGELILPSSEDPIVTMGGAGRPAVRAELDEADAGKVGIGDDVVVRSDAHGGEAGSGRVVAVAPLVARRRIGEPSSGRLSVSDVQEVRIEMEGSTDLLPGARVDVFFKPSSRQTKEVVK